MAESNVQSGCSRAGARAGASLGTGGASRRAFLRGAASLLPLAAFGPGALAGAPEARPNILLAIADDMSWPHLSCAGCKAVQTPAIDGVARRGVVFQNGFCAAPGCSPSRAALLTGRHVWMNEEAAVHFGAFPAKFATFTDLLAEGGYDVGFTGKGWAPGDWKAGGRKGNPVGPAFNGKTLQRPTTGIADNDYAANFADFLARRPPGRPFCFWYGGKEPHRIYQTGSGRDAGKRIEDVAVNGFLPDTPEVRSDFLDYYLEIEWFDRHLGLMLRALEQAGELDNTLVIVTGDNGMPFLRAKATCYEYGLHVPMVVSWPKRVPPGRTIEDPVGFVDLNATILAAADIRHPHAETPALAPVGRSLLPLLASGRQGLVDPAQAFVFAGHERHTLTRHNDIGYPIRALRTPQYLYLRNLRPERWPAGDPRRYAKAGGPLLTRHPACYRDIDDSTTLKWLIERGGTPPYDAMLERIVGRRPAEELYDIRTDPDCLRNLAASPEHAAAKAELATRMDECLERTADPRVHGPNRDVFDTYGHFNPKNPMGTGLYPPPEGD